VDGNTNGQFRVKNDKIVRKVGVGRDLNNWSIIGGKVI